MASKLNLKQQRFCEEYIIDLNATRAAKEAGYSARTAYSIGNENLSKPEIQEYIQQLVKERSQRTEITADMVLKRFWEIATVDPNEIIQLRRVCCRFCYGKDHEYQWTEKEFRRAEENAIQENKPIPVNAGGFGFDHTLDPHPKCPDCRGEGREDVHLGDTRKLSGPAKALYAGIKQSRDGMEVKLNSQIKALENVARHLGMFTEKPAPPPAAADVIPQQEYTLQPDEDVPDAPIL
ncbi:terminase small subunit [Hymenobacter sp. HSC-4F20]|uniref:terminase small subunit n=1 Tax=Hymenobacter sp. HSC-4F20 TaxID=2864135 RepID=UPI001C73432A|nr:terminase small subunit [Hymenobacter sp. HSC-4F20]MBX0289709.1 terminase small subunit [Hymenobacter sp. HSC-4F20]